MRMRLSARLWLLLVVVSVAPFFGSTAVAAGSAPVADLHASPGLVEWTPLVEAENTVLSVADPAGLVRTFQFAMGEAPALSLFDAQGAPLPDGTYTWEIRVTPRGTAPLVQSGYFTLSGGNLVAPDLAETPAADLRVTTAPDQMVPDDLIVDGKGCVGLGCTNNEAFGTEALRLKQSVVRLRFEDTSSQGGFPARDWQLTLNDSASGGADRFSVEDLTAGTTPLTVRGGAPNNSLYVDGVGNIGAGTATPAQDLHIASGSAPTLRFEQTSGTVRTWDVGASNASFFLKDVTNAAAIPFRINAGAPTSSVEVVSSGFVGLGTASPAARLHIRAADPGFGTKLLVESTGPPGARELFELRNNGGATFIFEDTTVPERWGFGIFADKFLIDNQANGGLEYIFGATGNLTIAGTLVQNSDRATKTDIQPIDPRAVLSKMAELPISTWRKAGDIATHLGPMAQDFRAAFGLGEDEHHIAPGDLAGVSLAAIQGLHAMVEEQRQVIDRQQELIGKLEERLRRLEAREQPDRESPGNRNR
jgi:hypothetical protein